MSTLEYCGRLLAGGCGGFVVGDDQPFVGTTISIGFGLQYPPVGTKFVYINTSLPSSYRTYGETNEFYITSRKGKK